MAKECCQTGGQVMILACSGGSNVGQITNQAAVELTREGFGKMFCLAGIGGGLKGFVQSARDVADMVVIDGCPVGCAKSIMDNAGIEMKNYLVVTDLGIEKVKDRQLTISPEDVDTVKRSARESMRPAAPAPAAAPSTPGCSCGQ
jgi:uncharacterized metal-binding protein